MPFYPVDRIPVEIESALHSMPKKPHKPFEPHEPQIFILKEKPSFRDAKLGLIIISSFVVNLIIGIYTEFPLCYLLAFMSAMGIATNLHLVFVAPFVYLSKSSEYEACKEKAEEKHKIDIKFYREVSLPEFPKIMSDWEIKIKEMSTASFIHEHRIELIKAVLKKSGVPRKHPSVSTLKKGATESNALTYLNSFFAGKVYVDSTFIAVGGEAVSKPPLPDFIIHDSEIGYNVIIEIDEPYDLEFGYVIHCIGQDDKRDEYFLKQNWPILRFAEKQFLLNPLECCDYIASYINHITLGISDFKVSGIYSELELIQCWTMDDAVILEANGFRETYLSSELLGGGLMGHIYKSNGPELRRKRRESKVAEEAEIEKRRVQQLSQESGVQSRYKFIDGEETDLPF